MQNISEIISALGVIAAAWFSYNQYTRNKLTDLKIEQYKREQERSSLRRADHSGVVFGELWNILHTLGADRVYIVQPHPLGNESLLSVYFEVKRKGVEPMKPHIQQLPIADVARFNRQLVETPYMYIDDIDAVDDKVAHSMLSSFGCGKAIVYKLNDRRHDWTGSIFCEFTREGNIPSAEEARSVLKDAAATIQYLLPEYKTA